MRVCLSSSVYFTPFFLLLFFLSVEDGRGGAADHVHVCMLVRAHACMCANVCMCASFHAFARPALGEGRLTPPHLERVCQEEYRTEQ